MVAASVAEGPSELSASIKSCHINQGLKVSDKDEVAATSKITIEAVIDFPECFKGYTLLAEITGVDEIRLWEDIDLDHRCLGRIDWFGESASTLHLAAHLSLDTLQHFRCLLFECKSEPKRMGICAEAIGLESIEFKERELPKGVAVLDVSIAVRRVLDKEQSKYMGNDS